MATAPRLLRRKTNPRGLYGVGEDLAPFRDDTPTRSKDAMHVTVIAVGTRGDVQPMLALAGGLRAATHRVRFATERTYGPSVVASGMDFVPLSGDSETFNSGRIGAIFRESVEKPVTRYARFWKSYVTPTARIHLRECVGACAGTDLIVCQPWMGIGPSLSDRFGVPAVIAGVFPVPELPTKEFPFPLHRGARADLAQEANWRSWRRAIPFLRCVHDSVQEWRVGVLGLRRQGFRDCLERMNAAPHVLGYSPLVLPKPVDWHGRVDVTGYWFIPPDPDYRPPRELEEFLADGDPPVVVGFGSHVGANPARLTGIVVDALASAGRRGVLIAGWGGLTTDSLPANVFGARSIPYDWLLPRSAGLVHHGGSGTTAVALRTGAPQAVVPFGWDQSFWGHRVARLGVGTAPVPSKGITAEALAAAIERMTQDAGISLHAARMKAAIVKESGVTRAVSALEAFMSAAPTDGREGDPPCVPIPSPSPVASPSQPS